MRNILIIPLLFPFLFAINISAYSATEENQLQSIAQTHFLPLPKAGTYKIKEIQDLNILYVKHEQHRGHISNSLIKLVQYYLLNANDDYQVIFPQFSFELESGKETYIAIEYQGKPKETENIKIKKLKGGLFATYIFKGSYVEIGQAIEDLYQRIIKQGTYVPESDNEIRLLYWNSIDDNQPHDLITEIQVKIQAKN